MEEMIQFYYYELKDVLERLGYDMKKLPTLHAFQIQVYRKYIYGEMKIKVTMNAANFCFLAAFTSGVLIFAVMISQDKDADFESLQNLDERAKGFKRRIYQNPHYQKIAKKTLAMLDRRGVLDGV